MAKFKITAAKWIVTGINVYIGDGTGSHMA